MKDGESMRKIVLVGCGSVGTAYAYSLVNQGFVTELVLIDANKEKAEGEAMDLVHGMAFASTNMRVYAGDYSDCKDARIVVITAGANQKPGETRLQLVERNTRIMQSIIQNIKKSGFDGIIVLASNPVDVLSYVAYKESGLPASRVIGSGTTLDSARFRVLLGEYFEVDPHNVHAVIVGEHGDSQLPVFSQASVGVESFDNLLERRNNEKDKENLTKIFGSVRDAAYEIINRKGVTNFGIGMCLTRITKAILNNEHSILPVSCLLNGEYGQEDIYMSVPAVVTREGVKEVIELKLNDNEQELFNKSADILREIRVK
ncbi:L-lactate dehydrogenase [Priestia flexa]|uniref:L-lactate dehydrogenase n=1 Tax=Priestia flexa TaxID=86664 RepID=A0ABU4J5Q1_9BACI|nr:L-lactate dehydrogenase [Priestia flexa]MCA1200437.1 L-lactate dehydrogenase [Priestia flexa]MDW8516319.1 L-lactate dehydrogenase [Priestia flexa]WEZ10248.1 L-lactate dehydrogenase [Priestia flexa]WHX80985.1 L-lactate dehydrogenase [Priestia flexa]